MNKKKLLQTLFQMNILITGMKRRKQNCRLMKMDSNLFETIQSLITEREDFSE